MDYLTKSFYDNDHEFGDDTRCNRCGMKSSYFYECIKMLKDWSKKEQKTDEFKQRLESIQKCRRLY